MSDDEPSANSATGKSRLTLNQAQHLKKPKIIAELRARGVEVQESEQRDALRAKLVTLVKAEIANSTAATKETAKTDNKDIVNADNPLLPEDEHPDSERDSSEDDIMSEAKIFFRLESDDWEDFTERLKLHFLVKKITTAEMKRAYLLTCCDEETYKLFQNLCASEKPASKPYEDLVKLLQGHLKPKPSEVMERCIFNRAKQEQNEKVADFATRLRRLAINCNFADLNTALRDQFVCGILNEAIRVDLFKLDNLTFEAALKEATARETAMKDAAGAIRNLTNKDFKHENFSMKSNKGENSRHERSKHDQSKGEGRPSSHTQKQTD